jgi:hypothetical protein
MVNIIRYQPVEILIGQGSTIQRNYFTDQPNLRNAQIQGIQVYTSNDISASPLTGNALSNDTSFKQTFLTLYSGDNQLVYNIPLVSLHNIVNTTNSYIFELPQVNNSIISWTLSYIQTFSNYAQASGSQFAFAFGVYYKLPMP